jgi:hypothetical protein
MKKGIVEEEMEGNKLIRIGGADRKVTRIFIYVAVPLLLLLAVWVFREISPSPWRPLIFLAIYVGAMLFYGNGGVWLHEQLHMLGFRGTVNEQNTEIFYNRKFLLGLKGHYSVTGDIAYSVMQRALLMPLVLAASFVVVGLVGRLFLPGWWLPILLSLAILSVFDMIHDIYMVSKIRKIGDRGTYQDKGHYLEVTIKD